MCVRPECFYSKRSHSLLLGYCRLLFFVAFAGACILFRIGKYCRQNLSHNIAYGALVESCVIIKFLGLCFYQCDKPGVVKHEAVIDNNRE